MNLQVMIFTQVKIGFAEYDLELYILIHADCLNLYYFFDFLAIQVLITFVKNLAQKYTAIFFDENPNVLYLHSFRLICGKINTWNNTTDIVVFEDTVI